MIESRKVRMLEKIQSMSEADFTKSILTPLFEAMGYRVDYYGGQNERGKDLICFKEGEFGDQEITAVQVKKTRPTAVASDSKNGFSEIITQLQQASEEQVPLLAGRYQVPNRVYFITPFEIDARALESRFAGLQHLTLKNVKVLDGANIIESLQKRLPKLADILCGENYMLQEVALLNISNKDLLSALNYSTEKDVVDFYCDLDFSVGRVTSKLFFSLEFAPLLLPFSVTRARWGEIRDAARRFASTSGACILDPSVEEIESTHELQYAKWNSEENKSAVKHVWKLISEIEQLFKFIIEEAGGVIDATFALSTNQVGFAKPKRELTNDETIKLRELSVVRDNINIDYAKWFEKTDLNAATINQIKALINSAERYISNLRNDGVVINAAETGTLKRLISNISQLNKLYASLEEAFSARTNEPVYNFSINGAAIANALSGYREFVLAGADKLSRTDISRDEVKSYFTECHQIFALVELVLSEKLFSEAAGLNTGQRFSVSSGHRISLPVNEVFATGIHCAIYGEAGAGKSTTLHRYACSSIKYDRDDDVTLWVPLTRVLTIENISGELPIVQKLEHALSIYLSSNGTIRFEDVIPYLRAKRSVVFIFDGVDEVIKFAPWITTAIHDLSNHYPRCQIIVSARSTRSYPELNDFLGLTLLPFTEEQVEFFVKGWFKNCPTAADAVVAHLRNVPAVAEVARNPLLATVLCVLAANEVPLPRGELAMYSERMNLLLGHYDIHKQAKRQTSHRSLLMDVARKIAFSLHKSDRRSAPLDSLQAIARTGMALQNAKPSKERIDLAVTELIDPCNVLVPMTNMGAYGFGHLRYQEYLCAEELHQNRSIDLLPLLSSSWWRPVIVLFCRLHGGVEFLINDVIGREHSVEKYYETLMAVLATQSKSEQIRLKPLIRSHRQMDQFSADIRELSEHSVEDTNLSDLGLDYIRRGGSFE